MRELKFRAWDSFNGCFHYPSNGGLSSLAIFFKQMADYQAGGNNISLSMDTGLKDKNGKEIYEGDILYHEGNFGCITGWGGGEVDGHPSTKLVSWFPDDCKFNLDFIDIRHRGRGVSGYSFCAENCKHSFEIKGNIHQNPELL